MTNLPGPLVFGGGTAVCTYVSQGKLLTASQCCLLGVACQHEYVRTVELSNLCSLDEATANGEKGFRGTWMVEDKVAAEKGSLFSFARIDPKTYN